MKNEKIGLLYRVSSKPQETDGGSLDVQKDMGRRISKKLGVSFIEFNEGTQSSYNIEVNLRPKLVELLNEIQKKNGIRKVWVFNTDRLGRTSQSWYSILKVFLDYGVQIYIGEDYKKPYDLTNSVDKLVIGVLSLISQYDNELRRMRSILGKRSSLRGGNTFVGGTPPFGYKVNGKHLVIDSKESIHVEKMFNMYNSGKTTMDIKIYLDNQLDVKPRRSKKGWNVGTVLSMLKKEVYKGIQKWEWKENLPNGESQIVETIEVKVPKIISEKLWNSVQERTQRVYSLDFHGKSRKSLLTGLLVCPKCKLKLGHRFKTNNHYFGRCTEDNWKKIEKKHNINDCPLKKSPRIEQLDEKIMSVVLDIVKESSILREDYKKEILKPKFQEEEILRKRKETLERSVRGKRNELSGVEDKKMDLEFEFRLNEMKKSRFNSLTLRFDEHIKKIQEELNNLESKLKVINETKGWVDWLEKMNSEINLIENYNLQRKKEFLKGILNEIEIRYDKNNKSHLIDLKFKLPLVGDSIIYGEKRDSQGFKVYDIQQGKIKYQTELKSFVPNKSKKQSQKNELIERIVYLKEIESKTFEEISEMLNDEGLKPLNGGKWYKSKVSSFYNYNRKVVPK